MPFIIGGLVGAAAGAAGGLIKGATKTGKDTTQTTNFGNSAQYDPSQFKYGGNAGGADEAANRDRQQAEQAQGRQGPQANFQYAQPNYNNSAQWGNLVGADRGAQSQVAGMMLNRATGQTPSIAGMQSHQDISQLQQNAQMQGAQAQAAQASQAASARGPAAMALAQQNAANNTATAQGQIGQGAAMATQNISNQAQINAANERMQAEQAAQNAFTGMRTGDTGMVNDEAQRAQFNAGLTSQQQQFNAGLQSDQAARNDAMTLGMTAQEQGVRNTALQGGIAQQRTLAGSSDADQAMHAQQGARNAAWENNNFDSVTKSLTGGAAAGAVPHMAHGGPIAVGTPYLVGEKGPELIVPRYDGTVIPAGPTAALLRGGARAAGGPVSGPRMLSPAPAGAPKIAGQMQVPVLAKGGRGKPAAPAKPPPTMPLEAPATARMNRYGEEIPAADANGPQGNSSQFNGWLDRAAMRPDPQNHGYLAPPAAQEAEPATDLESVGRGSTTAATPEQQAQFERKLTGQPEPEGRYQAPDLNTDDADKIRQSFAADKQRDDATARWEQSFGKASAADAGTRDGTKPAMPMWQQVVLGATGRLPKREDGGPVKGVMEGYDPLADKEQALPPLPPAKHERQMQTFQRDGETFYIDPRFPSEHRSEGQEYARRVAAAGDTAASIMNPGLAIFHATGEVGTEGGAIARRLGELAQENAGNVPTRTPVALAKGGPKQLNTESTPTRKPATEQGQLTPEEVQAALLRGAFETANQDEEKKRKGAKK